MYAPATGDEKTKSLEVTEFTVSDVVGSMLAPEIVPLAIFAELIAPAAIDVESTHPAQGTPGTP
jgi:hypothetical protein